MRTHNNCCTEGFRLEIEADRDANLPKGNEECFPTQKIAAPEISKKDSAHNLNKLAAQKICGKSSAHNLTVQVVLSQKKIFFELVGNPRPSSVIRSSLRL